MGDLSFRGKFKQGRGDPRKEWSQLRQIFRECALGVGACLVKTAGALLNPPASGAQVSRMCQMPNTTPDLLENLRGPFPGMGELCHACTFRPPPPQFVSRGTKDQGLSLDLPVCTSPCAPAARLPPLSFRGKFKQARGDPQKELAQLHQIFRECVPRAGTGVVKSPSGSDCSLR